MRILARLILFCGVLCLSECLAPLCAQSNGTIRFNDTKGDRVVSAADVKYKKFVTCSHTDDDRSCFLVEDFENNTRKKFYTTAHVEPSMQYSCSGYIVNEMVVDDGKNCWFCGSKWVRTGQYVYTIEGLLVPETLYYGYVGRFNIINDVLNGGGNMEIMLINGSDNLQHFALTPSGDIYATEDNLIYHITPAGGGGYNVTRGIINHDGAEKFMGVVCTGDTIVTLARCLEPGHFFYFHDMFYLGCGPRSDFINSNIVNDFDVYIAYGDRRARMGTDTPIHLTATNKGNGVVVSYIAENDEMPNISFPGKLLMFHFPNINSGAIPEILHNVDTGTYVKIKDIKSSDSVWGNPFIAALLEDNHGNSVWRLPMLGGLNDEFYDTVRKIRYPSMESIVPFRNPGIDIHKSSLYLSGYYPLAQNRVARNISYNIRNDDSRGDKIPIGCYTASLGYWWVNNSLCGMGPSQFHHITIGCYNSEAEVAVFEQIPIVSIDAPYTAICIDPIPVKDEQEN